MRTDSVTVAGRTLAVLAVVVGFPPALAQETRLDIVDRSIEHHGGESFQASRTRLEVCSASGCYQLSVTQEAGLYDFDVKGKVRGGERRVRSTNSSVEAWMNGEPVEIEEDRRLAYRNWAMARVYFCFLPFRLNDASVLKEDLGIEEWGGQELHKVKVTFRAGSSSDADDEYLYWFDPDTARLVQFAYSFEGRPGGLRFRRAFNYRRKGGILFFDQENWGLAGDDLRVDQMGVDLVHSMRRISTVELKNILVEEIAK